MKILFSFSLNKRPQRLKVNKESDREEEEWLCVGETTYVTEEDFQTQLECQMDAIFICFIQGRVAGAAA